MATDMSHSLIHSGHRANMRQRYLSSGLDGFQDHEVLELLLFYVFSRQNTNLMAHELISSCGSLQAVLNAPPDELTETKGIGSWGALLLNLIPRLLILADAPEEPVFFDSNEDAVNFMARLLRERQTPCRCQMYVGNDNRLLYFRLSEDNVSSPAPWNVREVTLNTLVTGAVKVFLGRSCAVDEYKPREIDYGCVQQTNAALDFVHVRLTDYCLVSTQSIISLRENGYLPDD